MCHESHMMFLQFHHGVNSRIDSLPSHSFRKDTHEQCSLKTKGIICESLVLTCCIVSQLGEFQNGSMSQKTELINIMLAFMHYFVLFALLHYFVLLALLHYFVLFALVHYLCPGRTSFRSSTN